MSRFHLVVPNLVEKYEQKLELICGQRRLSFGMVLNFAKFYLLAKTPLKRGSINVFPPESYLLSNYKKNCHFGLGQFIFWLKLLPQTCAFALGLS